MTLCDLNIKKIVFVLLLGLTVIGSSALELMPIERIIEVITFWL